MKTMMGMVVLLSNMMMHCCFQIFSDRLFPVYLHNTEYNTILINQLIQNFNYIDVSVDLKEQNSKIQEGPTRPLTVTIICIATHPKVY